MSCHVMSYHVISCCVVIPERRLIGNTMVVVNVALIRQRFFTLTGVEVAVIVAVVAVVVMIVE